jgi:hypothetical protein
MFSTRSRASLLAGLLLLPAALLPACGPSRTAAKAVAIVDALVVASGGETAWAKAKELSFTAKVTVDGKEKVNAQHDWDRWNGRHRFEKSDPVSKADLMVAYEQFGTAAFGEIDGHGDIPRDQVAKMKGEAEKRIAIDAFNLFMPFKLKDPGVVLKLAEERPDPATPDKPAFDVVKVTFDAGVGITPGDVYYVVVDKNTHLVHQVEIVEQGKKDDERIGYKWDDYQDIGGLKLSMKRQNIGYAAEVLEFSDVKVSAEVEEGHFVPEVQ